MENQFIVHNSPVVYLSVSGPIDPRTMTFHNAKTELVGTLKFDGEKMTFTGNVDESAQLFFDAFIHVFEREHHANTKRTR